MQRRTRRSLFLLSGLGALTALVVLLAPSEPAGADLPAGFADIEVFGGLDLPTDVEFASDGRIFVTEKDGLVKVFDGVDDTDGPDVVVDLTTEVHNLNDRGLLGLAVHPNFPTTPELFVLYARNRNPQKAGSTVPEYAEPVPNLTCSQVLNFGNCVIEGRIAKLTLGPAGTAQAVTPLLTAWCQTSEHHTVGDLEFGPDGYLYASAGDGAKPFPADDGSAPPNDVATECGNPARQGGAMRSQDARNTADPLDLTGSVIRIDPATGAGVAGNPRFGSADANFKRVVGYGFRNPFRIAHRPGSSEVYVADVGWMDWEEINRIDMTGSTLENYGWPCYEGDARQRRYDNADIPLCEQLYSGVPAAADLRTPHYAYPHCVAGGGSECGGPMVAGGDCVSGGQGSITGMAFYEGGDYPAAYDNALFFADFARDCLLVMFPGAGGVPDPSTVTELSAEADDIVDLEIGPNGDVFYLGIGAEGLGQGNLHRLTFTSGNQFPLASVTADPTSGALPLAVDFDASGSTDPDGPDASLTYEWDLDGDGQFDDGTGATISRTYTVAQNVTVRVRVTDVVGGDDIATIDISAGNEAPVIALTSPSPSLRWKVGDVIPLSATVTDAEDGVLGGASVQWDVGLEHCPRGSACHTHPQGSFTGTSGSVTGSEHEMDSFLKATITATDSQGVETMLVVEILPLTAEARVATDPDGAPVDINDRSGVGPFSTPVIVGSPTTFVVPAMPTIGGTAYTFDGWGDGTATPSRTDVMPATGLDLIARFVPAGSRSGYWIVEEDGDVTPFGDAPDLGDVEPPPGVIAVAIAAHPDGNGYWVLQSDGDVVAKGSAIDFGAVVLDTVSAPARKPGEDVASLAPNGDGSGVWVFTNKGRIIALGAATPASAMANGDVVINLDLDGDIVGTVPTPTGGGAFMVGADGGVFNVGDAVFVGSVRDFLPPGASLDQPAVGIVADPDGGGYWVVAADGGVFGIQAPFVGSLPAIVPFSTLVSPVNGMVPFGNGYILVAGDGGVFVFSDLPFSGSGAGQADTPVVGVATLN